MKKKSRAIIKIALITVAVFFVAFMIVKAYYTMNKPSEVVKIEPNNIYASCWYSDHVKKNGQCQWYIQLRNNGSYSLLFDASQEDEDEMWICFYNGTYEKKGEFIMLDMQESIYVYGSEKYGYGCDSEDIAKSDELSKMDSAVLSWGELHICKDDGKYFLIGDDNSTDMYKLFEFNMEDMPKKVMPENVDDFIEQYNVEIE